MSGDALSLEPAPDLLVGKTLADRYRVVRRLGQGGMGAVYEGEHLLIKKRVAIKVLHPQFAASADVVARFHREALAATAIGHEHIVEVNDMGRTPEGAPFMVLEFLKGRDFADLLDSDGPQPIGRVVHILSQVADAVQAAHDTRIVHRDLKPENIYLVTRGGDPDFVKVLDFGISKMRDAESDESGARATTKTGAVLGTAYYMAPEQAMGKKSVDHRADVWALGVILFRALALRYPFEDDAYPMLVVRICSETPPGVRQFRPDVPIELERIITHCLEKDPSARMPSCNALREQLAPFRRLMTAPELAKVLPATKMSDAPPSMPVLKASGPEAFAATGASGGGGAAVDVLAVTGHASTGSGMVVAATPRPSRALVLGAISLAAVVFAVAGAFVLGGGRPDVAPEPSTPTVEPTQASSAPLPAAPADPPVLAAIERVHIDIRTTPAEAALFIDDRPVANPYSADRRVDDQVHTVRAELTGHRTFLQDLWLEDPQTIAIPLTRGRGFEDTRARREHATTAPSVPAPEVVDVARQPEPPPLEEPPPAVPPPIETPPIETPPIETGSGATAPPPRAGLKTRPSAPR